MSTAYILGFPNQEVERGFIKYLLPFYTSPRRLFKIGVNFSTETKLIDDWKVEEA